MGASDPAASLSPAPGPFSYEHEGDRQFATTLARGLEVLRCFTPLEPLLGSRDVGQRTDPFLPRLTPEGTQHPIFANISGFFPTTAGEARILGLPPLDG